MLLWADGADHWGSSVNMQASYIMQYQNAILERRTGALARTGNSYSYIVWYQGVWAARMFGGARTTVGAGIAFHITTPINAPDIMPLAFCGDTANAVQVSIIVNPDGSVSAYQGQTGQGQPLGALLGTSDPGKVAIGAYTYVEAKVFCDPVNGTVVVRVNNQIVLGIAGANTAPRGYSRITGVGYGNRWATNGAAIPDAWADFVIWDSVAPNNDFYGDIRCRTRYMNANGADQDWALHGQANAYDCINQVPPNPGVSYLSASNVGDKSSFLATPIPTNTSAIFGIMMFGNINKTDSGTCEVTMGIDSNGSPAIIPAIAPGTGAAFYSGAIQVDPDGGGSWTYGKINTMLSTIERTA